MPEDHNNKERPYRTFTSSGEHSGTLGAAGDYTRWYSPFMSRQKSQF
jgi:hypothetical protein